MWRLALPRSERFATYEVKGALLAPDGTIVVMTVPFIKHAPYAAMLAKVTLDGRLVWSMRLAEDLKRVVGPFPQDMTIDADGTIRLAGHATYQRERKANLLRDWRGTVSATGRQLSDVIGGEYAWSFETSPATRRVFSFWYDLFRPYESR